MTRRRYYVVGTRTPDGKWPVVEHTEETVAEHDDVAEAAGQAAALNQQERDPYGIPYDPPVAEYRPAHRGPAFRPRSPQ